MVSEDHSPKHFIREWRRHRGLTQDELANAIRVDRTYLNKIERGKRRYIPSVLEAMAETLGCAPGDLISRRPDQTSEIEALYMSLSAEDRSRAIAVLKTVFGRP
jgi:transcriptional regulator with XRE-family HTH domain